jgi:hypothetical protein
MKCSISSISASIGKSLSCIFMTSPILKGNEKNKITPDVMLLKIDHWAKQQHHNGCDRRKCDKISLVCTPK